MVKVITGDQVSFRLSRVAKSPHVVELARVNCLFSLPERVAKCLTDQYGRVEEYREDKLVRTWHADWYWRFINPY